MSSKSSSASSFISTSPVPVNSGRSAEHRIRRFFNMPMPQKKIMIEEPVAPLASLSASLVHDLRNPVAAISAGAELLIDMNLPCPQSKRLALNIYRASRRVEELLRELVDLSRGGHETREFCKLADVIQSASAQIADAAEAQNVDVAVVVPDWMELCLERKRMERAFLNMMINAVESMPRGGQLHISARLDRDEVEIQIDDTGRGIAAHIRQRLFQPFFSGEEKNGIGLGLALSRQTVMDHGGALWLGEKTGQGALFCMRLPL
jgi:signal transduction histidine kinase